MSDILAEIAAYKRDEVAARKALRPLEVLEASAREASEPRGFRAALERAHAPGRLALIAEIKKASPSRGLIRADGDPPALARAAGLKANLVGVNNRDLRTFSVDLAVTERLAMAAPPGVLLVTESGIFTPADAQRLERSGAKAMLVGESLMRQANVAEATRALLTV